MVVLGRQNGVTSVKRAHFSLDVLYKKNWSRETLNQTESFSTAWEVDSDISARGR